MPKRETKEEVKLSAEEVDLTFLPEDLMEEINRIFQNYFKLGIPKISQKIDEGSVPNFPNNISSLNSDEVGNEQAKFTAWYNYVIERFRYVSVACSVMEKAAQEELDASKIRVAQEKRDWKPTVEEKLSLARQDPSYIAIVKYKIRLDGMKDMLDNDLKKLDKSIASLSRDISRRERIAGW